MSPIYTDYFEYTNRAQHTAILYQTRRELAIAVKRLLDAGYPLTGAADHGVSEAIYLDDPDENGVELYYDRPKDHWPKKLDGSVEMYTRPLSIKDLLLEIKLSFFAEANFITFYNLLCFNINKSC